jgi:hypothetical protein
MLELGVGAELSAALVNAALLALWAALPGFLLGYIRQSLSARPTPPEFSLHKSEAGELNRAVQLYQRVCLRLNEINDRQKQSDHSWPALFSRWLDVHQPRSDEIEDLEAHAHHLRAMILRLQRRPLQRLKSWVHTASSRYAFGRALITHVVGLVVLVVAFHVCDQPIWARTLRAGDSHPVVWYPFDARLFYANAIAALVAALAVPLFYLVQRLKLRQSYWLEFSQFKEFAAADPDLAIGREQAMDPAQDALGQEDATEAGAVNNWFSVLGVADSASAEEIRQAYRALIRQNHPDRVHDMSPAFKRLAEAESKKINVAYQQALVAVLSREVAVISRESGRTSPAGRSNGAAATAQS